MATYATLTVNAEDIIGADFDKSRASAYIEAGGDDGVLEAIKVDNTLVRIGGRRESPDSTGTITFGNLVTTNSAANPTTFFYRVKIIYTPKGSRRQGHDEWVSAWFPLTATSNLASIDAAWDNVAAPVSWRSDFIDQAQALLDQQEAISGANTADALITVLDANSASAFRVQQDARQAASLLPVRARDRARTQAERPGGRSLFVKPTGFTVDIGIPVIGDGQTFTTNYDVAVQANVGGATYYVNHLTGNDTTGTGTSGTPWRSVDKAVTSAADGDTIIVQAGGIIWKAYGAVNTITKRLNIKAAPGVAPTFVAADLLTWSATAGRTNVYEAARTNVRKVVDLVPTADGFPYVRAASLSACEATPGSWYQASNGTGLVYVHTLTNAAPDPQTILALLTVSLFSAETTGRTSNSRLYLEGIRCIGSDRGWYLRSDTSWTMLVAAKDCTFLHGGYSGVSTVDATGLYNGLSVLGNVSPYFQRVRVAYSCLDGFNYHELSARRPAFFVEIDCEAHDCGNQSAYDGTTSIPLTNNASTSHDTIPGVRINGKYHHTYGPVLADTGAGTKTLNLGCDVWGSLDPAGGSAFSALGDATMWVYGGRAWGTAADIYAVSGTTLRAEKTEADTVGGAGSISIVSPR